MAKNKEKKAKSDLITKIKILAKKIRLHPEYESDYNELRQYLAEIAGPFKNELDEYKLNVDDPFPNFDNKILKKLVMDIMTDDNYPYFEFYDIKNPEEVSKLFNRLTEIGCESKITSYEKLVPILNKIYSEYYPRLISFCDKYGLTIPIPPEKFISMFENISEDSLDYIDSSNILLNNNKVKTIRDSIFRYFKELNDSVIFVGSGCGFFSEDFVDKDGNINIKIKKDADISLEMITLLIRNRLKAMLPQNERFRTEQLKAMEVWEEWMNMPDKRTPAQKSYKKISEKLKIEVGTVKARWRRAFEIVYGHKFTLELFQNKFSKAISEHKENMKNKADELCAKCKSAECYEQYKHSSKEWDPCQAYVSIYNPNDRSHREFAVSIEQLEARNYNNSHSVKGRKSHRKARIYE